MTQNDAEGVSDLMASNDPDHRQEDWEATGQLVRLTKSQKDHLYRSRHPLRWRCSALYLYAQKRVKGLTKHHRPDLWRDVELCSKKEFDGWFYKHIRQATKMYRRYIDSGKKRGLALSIHRIDSSRGYIPSNMALVTVSENSRMAAFLGHQKQMLG